MDPNVPVCPVCTSPMSVKRLECAHCGTALEGRFSTPFAGLSPELISFAERFIRARGNLKEMERGTGLSYPGLRSRLDDLVQALGGEVSPQEPSPGEAVLDRLRAGEISAQDAIALLRGESAVQHGEPTEESDLK